MRSTKEHSDAEAGDRKAIEAYLDAGGVDYKDDHGQSLSEVTNDPGVREAIAGKREKDAGDTITAAQALIIQDSYNCMINDLSCTNMISQTTPGGMKNTNISAASYYNDYYKPQAPEQK